MGALPNLDIVEENEENEENEETEEGTLVPRVLNAVNVPNQLRIRHMTVTRQQEGYFVSGPGMIPECFHDPSHIYPFFPTPRLLLDAGLFVYDPIIPFEDILSEIVVLQIEYDLYMRGIAPDPYPHQEMHYFYVCPRCGSGNIVPLQAQFVQCSECGEECNPFLSPFE